MPWANYFGMHQLTNQMAKNIFKTAVGHASHGQVDHLSDPCHRDRLSQMTYQVMFVKKIFII